jgi:hypothetical protein
MPFERCQPRKCNISPATWTFEKLRPACVAAGFRPNVLVLNTGLFVEGSLMESSDAAFVDSLNENLGVHVPSREGIRALRLTARII